MSAYFAVAITIRTQKMIAATPLVRLALVCLFQTASLAVLRILYTLAMVFVDYAKQKTEFFQMAVYAISVIQVAKHVQVGHSQIASLARLHSCSTQVTTTAEHAPQQTVITLIPKTA